MSAAREKAFAENLFDGTPLRGYGNIAGHALEAQFPLGMALAALALKSGKPVPTFEATEAAMRGAARTALVTTIGYVRGEGIASLSSAGDR